MHMLKSSLTELLSSYTRDLSEAASKIPEAPLELLAESLTDALKSKRQVFLFGNGGSAGNAIHIANDWIYPISKQFGEGIRVHALPANPATITCLANDEGYDSIFAYQLAVLADQGDVAIALSGSGNSANVIEALKVCGEKGLKSFAILGYDGGKCKSLADHPIHIPVDDMQILEDLQLMIGHLLMKWVMQTHSSDNV